MTLPQTVPAVPATQRRWLIVFLVLIPVFVGSLDLTIVSAILPEVLTRLNIPVDTNLGSAAWMVTGYLLAYTVSMIIMGRLSDLVGRRGAFFACLVVFIFGSWWVATAHLFPSALFNDIARRTFGLRPDQNQMTLMAVIVGRVIQALGAGAIVPVSIALVADIFPPERRAGPVGLIGAFDTLGWVLGHLYGGLMVNFFAVNGEAIRAGLLQAGLNWPAPDWRTLFYANIPLGLVSMLVMLFSLRKMARPHDEGRFDFVGGILISLALVVFVVGLGGGGDVTGATSLSQLGSSGLPINLGLLGLGAIIFLLFLLWEWRQRYPLIDLHLFRHRNVSAATVANLLVGFCLMLGLVSVPLLVNLRADSASASSIALAAERAGILLSAFTIPMAIAALPGALLSRRVGFRFATVTGLLLAAVGFIWAGLTWRLETPEPLMALHMVLAGTGLGLTIAPIGTVVINAVNEHQRGVASALVLIMRLIGMTTAISLLTATALSRVSYLANLAYAAFPTGLLPDEIQRRSVAAYVGAGAQVIGEMLVVGGLLCLLAALPALLIRTEVPHE
jgi:MFS family permease